MSDAPLLHPLIRIHTLGLLHVELEGSRAPRAVSQRKTLALLALLAVAGSRGVSRDKILALLWPESPEDAGRNALAQLLFRCRRELGSDIVTGAGELRLNPERVTSDIEQLESAIATDQLERVPELYDGPFLDGFHLRETSQFERWVDDQRARFERLYLETLERLARRAADRNDRALAAEWWGRRAAAEPLSARAARSYLEALLAAGDREAALRYSRSYARLVRAELEAEPDPEFLRSVAQIRDSAAPVDASECLTTHESGPRGIGEDAIPPLATRAPRARWKSVVVRALAVVAVVSVVTGLLALRRAHDHGLVVLVGPFDNDTHDSTMDNLGRITSEWIANDLAAKGFATIEAQDRPASAGSEEPDLLASRGNADYMVSGSYHRVGDTIEFVARLASARRQQDMEVLPPAHSWFTAPWLATAEVSSRVAGALAALTDSRAATFWDATSIAPRFEAYREYVEGIDYLTGRRTGRLNNILAAQHFAQAARLDSTFDLANVWLLFSLGNLGMSWQFGNFRYPFSPPMDSALDRLARRADHLAPVDRDALSFFTAYKNGDQQAAYRAAVAASELAPLSIWTYVRGEWAGSLGYFDDAVAAFRQLDVEELWLRSWPPYWRDFADVLHRAGRFDEQLAVARRAAQLSIDPLTLRALAVAFGTRGDVGSLDRFADSIDAAPLRLESWSVAGAWLTLAALEANAHGHLEAARRMADRCIRFAHAHPPDTAIGGDYNLWLNRVEECLYLARRWDEATVVAEEMAARPDPAAIAGAWLLVLIPAQQGDTATMHRRRMRIFARQDFVSDSSNRLVLQARLAALAHDPRATADNLRRAGKSSAWWHLLPELTPALRESRELRELSSATFQTHQ